MPNAQKTSPTYLPASCPTDGNNQLVSNTSGTAITQESIETLYARFQRTQVARPARSLLPPLKAMMTGTLRAEKVAADSRTYSEHTHVCISDEDLLSLEFRLRKATRGDAPRQSYIELVFRHTTAAAKGPAMETDKLMYGRSMTEAACDYPIACVAAFYRDWRKSPQGRWWPTESDLICGCDAHLGIWRDRHSRVVDEVLGRGLALIDPK